MQKQNQKWQYEKSFQKFLTHTDEKLVLLEEIAKRIKEKKSKSLLDIGAGNGDLVIPISKLMHRYMAIETRSAYVDHLRANHIEVMEAKFPQEIKEKFDFVLISHSLPQREEKYQPFITSALNLLNQGGTLLVITYDYEKGDWNELLKVSDLKLERIILNRLKNIENGFTSFSVFRKTLTKTYVRTNSMTDMVEALAFVYSDGDQEMIKEFVENKKVSKFLADHYKTGENYCFPIEHIFLEVTK